MFSHRIKCSIMKKPLENNNSQFFPRRRRHTARYQKSIFFSPQQQNMCHAYIKSSIYMHAKNKKEKV